MPQIDTVPKKTTDIVIAQPADRKQTPRVDAKENVILRDRGMALWAQLMSIAFTTLTCLCWLGLIVMGLFFQTMVVEQKNAFLASILILIGIIPIVSALIFDLAHARALTGFRAARTQLALKVRAAFGLCVTLILIIIAPALGICIVLGAFASFLFQRLDRFLVTADPLWDFNPAEATSILTGRDNAGLRLVYGNSADMSGAHFANSLNFAGPAITFVVGLGVASYLAATGVLSPSAVFVVTIASLWAAININPIITSFAKPQSLTNEHNKVTALDPPKSSFDKKGLIIHNLNLTSPKTGPILRTINMTLPPGKIVGVLGGTGDGKSMLLKALSDPFDLPGLDVTGSVTFNGISLWRNNAAIHDVPSVFVGAHPLLLPTTGLKNVTCFREDINPLRAQNLLEELLVSEHAAKRVLEADDATLLSASEQKALSIARAFLLNPHVYIFENPEVNANKRMLEVIAKRLKMERRIGRSCLLVTQDRALREACDGLIVMASGMVSDYGPVEEVTKRLSAGWVQIAVERNLDSEDILRNWVSVHFRRAGDEENRRLLAYIIGEFLAFSCASESNSPQKKILFDFRHQDGFCLLNMTDYGPAIGSTELAQARSIANGNKKQTADQQPLSEILHLSKKFEQEQNDNRRVLRLQVPVIDPRKIKPVQEAQYDKTAT